MKTRRSLVFGVSTLLVFAALAQSQSWTALAHQPTVPIGTALLLTDGTVMAQQMQTSGFATGQWWRLTPDSTGSYTNGSWVQLASMPSGYAPLYYASAVLSDGRVVFEGGEYNNTSQSETNLGRSTTQPQTAGPRSPHLPGGVRLACNQATILTASATICGNSCVTDSVAPPVPVSSLGAGDGTLGTGGSCSLNWSWGGNNYSQFLNVP